MKVGASKYHRKSTRIQGYDYATPGFYFITICTKNREMFFGEIRSGRMELSEGGKIVLSCWREIPLHYPKVKLHPFIIMPNHIHGIVEITSMTIGSKTPNQNGPHDMIPHERNHDVGVQYFEPLQNDQSHGESDVWIENIEPKPNDHQEKMDSNKHKSGKLKNEYQHIIPGSIGSIVRGFEIGVTKCFRTNTDVSVVWQRNFYDRIIRTEKSFRIISKYIADNPKNWKKDDFNNNDSNKD